jgi:hypothetical protein
MARYDLVTPNVDASGAGELVPDIVVNEVTVTAEREEVFMPLVMRRDVTGPGEVFHHPTGASVAFAVLGGQTYIDGAEPAEVLWDTGERTFTPRFYFVDIILPMDVPSASNINVQQKIIDEVGVGWALHRDSLFAALYTEAPAAAPAHEVGTDGIALAYSNVTENTKLLYIQNAPRSGGAAVGRKGFSAVIHPTQWAELQADNTFIDAAKSGTPGGLISIGNNGHIVDTFDVSFHMSDQIDEVSGLHSMWFSTGRALAYYYKRLTHPLTRITSELMVGIAWNEARRSFEICNTYQAAAGGVKGTSTTTNNWLVDCIS